MMDELYHHGIKDMKWGVRRFQDYTGKLTAAGRERYGVGAERVKSALNTAKTMAKYSTAATTYRVAKSRARRKFRYGISPRLDMAKMAAEGRIGEASSKVRDVGERLGSRASSASRRLSRAATDASIQGRILGRELSYLSTTTMNKVNRVLSANNREAARLRSYVASDQWARAKKAQITNLKKQEEYKARKSAGEAFVKSLDALKTNTRVASEIRFGNRTVGDDRYGNGIAQLTGEHYSWVKKTGRSLLAKRAPALKIADDYEHSVNEWQRRIEQQRKFASSSFNRARGR